MGLDAVAFQLRFAEAQDVFHQRPCGLLRTHRGAGFGEVEKLGNQVVDTGDFADHIFQMAFVGFAQVGTTVQQLGRGFDNAQRIADFMGQAHSHFAQGMQAVAAAQLGFKMMQLAQTRRHMVEGAAQFGQLVVARHCHALVVVPGNHRAHAFGQTAQRPGKALGDQPANRQGQHRAEQEDQREQVGLVDQPHQAGMA